MKQKEKVNKMEMLKRINGYLATILVICGLLIVFVTLYYKPENVGNISEITKLIFSFFELLGFTLFTSGIFTFFLQLPDWQKYFEERLKSIVLEQEYLNSLDSTSLSNLQVKTLKAYYHTSDIDKEGSFLKYFQDNISQYISKSYRENVQSEINFLKEEIDGYLISDRIIYNCRMIGGRIQERIDWQPDKDEFIDVKSVSIRIKKCNSEFIEVSTLKNVNGKYEIDNNPEISFEEFMSNGLSFDLENYQVDGLLVEIKAIYKIKKGIFCTWSMAHPTKNLNIAIHYPENFYVFFKHFYLLRIKL